MKIGILTYQFSTNNYGAVLQTFASFKVLKNLGCQPEVINLLPGEKLCFLSKFKKYIKFYLYNNISFELFKKRHIKLTKPYYTTSNLKDLNKSYNAFYVGSDQVWRASMSKERLASYFLDFADDNKLKIAYAASFGISEWEGGAEITKKIRLLIKRFTALGVREQTGIDICRSVFDLDAVKVLDPTLLLDEDIYHDLIRKHKRFKAQDYIAYHVIQDKTFLGNIPSLALQQTKIKVINLFGENKKFLGHSFLRFNSIEHWLTGIENASLVITDSFHCVIFSIIFKKQFVCIPNERGGLSRIENLLQMLDIEDRFCTKKSCDYNYFLDTPINYDKVYARLNKFRDESFCFLTRNLDKTKIE